MLLALAGVAAVVALVLLGVGLVGSGSLVPLAGSIVASLAAGSALAVVARRRGEAASGR
ncbi:MAG: hypothetical protein AB7L84_02625 [Acidimicrobiia bacterium]